MGSLGDHIVFTAQFLQMCEDFKDVVENECPACQLKTRSDAICLNDHCDWMLFIAPNKLHPATLPWIERVAERIK